MAKRPIFIVGNDYQLYTQKIIEFKWNAGYAKIQKQKNIESIHKHAKKIGIGKILEISTKSKNEIGVKLSAFNLSILDDELRKKVTVEAAYQASKMFKLGGPYEDLIYKDPYEIKKDIRLKESGRIKGFKYNGVHWELIPVNAFYDWLYMNFLLQNKKLVKEIIEYDAFTDIEFNPKKQINCQARAAAIFVSLYRKNYLNLNGLKKKKFLELLKMNNIGDEKQQTELF